MLWRYIITNSGFININYFYNILMNLTPFPKIAHTFENDIMNEGRES